MSPNSTSTALESLDLESKQPATNQVPKREDPRFGQKMSFSTPNYIINLEEKVGWKFSRKLGFEKGGLKIGTLKSRQPRDLGQNGAQTSLMKSRQPCDLGQNELEIESWRPDCRGVWGPKCAQKYEF